MFAGDSSNPDPLPVLAKKRNPANEIHRVYT